MPRRRHPVSFEHVLGDNVRWRREDLKWRQDDLAWRMVRLGYRDWTQATVAAIEGGRRALSLKEALMLQWALGTPLPRLLARHAGEVDVDHVRLSSRDWRSLTTGQASEFVPAIETEDGKDRPRGTRASSRFAETALRGRDVRSLAKRYQASEREVFLAMQAASGTAERRVARKLKRRAVEVGLASLQLWNRPLTEERDARVEPSGNAASDRMRAAHVTRTLQQEIAGRIETVRRQQ